MSSQEHPVETTTSAGSNAGTGLPQFVITNPNPMTFKLPETPSHGYRGYCETLEQLSAFLRTSSAEAGEDAPNCARSISIRERAHREGELYSPLNGQQPIYALLGSHDLQTLEGRLLTIVDAISNDRQCKAMKDLIRNAIWFDWIPNLDTDDSRRRQA